MTRSCFPQRPPPGSPPLGHVPAQPQCQLLALQCRQQPLPMAGKSQLTHQAAVAVLLLLQSLLLNPPSMNLPGPQVAPSSIDLSAFLTACVKRLVAATSHLDASLSESRRGESINPPHYFVVVINPSLTRKGVYQSMLRIAFSGISTTTSGRQASMLSA